jgi:hypothetical protein
MAILFKDNASGKLAAPIISTDTSIVLETGQGEKFPSPTGDNYFPITLVGVIDGIEASWEIVYCTTRVTDTLTITRGQEGTIASNWVAETKVELRLTTGSLQEVISESVDINSGTIDGTTIGGTTAAAGNFTTVTTSTPIAVASGGTGVIAPGTSGNVLTSNGTTWSSTAPASSGISAGTAIALAMVMGG